jgi:hypothetical protein
MAEIETAKQDRITLKWGTLKSWDINTPAAFEFLKQWHALGSTLSAMAQHDTPEQTALLCQMIDASNVETVYLDWDGKEVTKEEAKEYLLNYGKPKPVEVSK